MQDQMTPVKDVQNTDRENDNVGDGIIKRTLLFVIPSIIIITAILFIFQFTDIFNSSEVAEVGDAERVVDLQLVFSDDETSSFEVDYQEDENVLDLLGRLEREPGRDFNFQVEEYSFGVFIIGFNGVEAAETEFWEFIVNEQPSSVGVEEVITRPGDEIKFKLTEL